MLFAGGPCTSGPGNIVSRSKTADMRSHADLAKGAAHLHKDACEFYAGLAHRSHRGGDSNSSSKSSVATAASPAFHVVDVFDNVVCISEADAMMKLALDDLKCLGCV